MPESFTDKIVVPVRFRGTVFGGCLSALLAILSLGCGSNEPAVETAMEPAESNAREPDSLEAEGLSIEYAAWPAIRDQVVGEGRVCVVDFWSLSCPPCLKELPELAELHRKSMEESVNSVRCVGVAVDFDGRKSKPPESYEPKIRSVLEAMDATFTNFICETASDEVFADLEISSIPAVFVYDAEGRLLKRFVDTGETRGFTYQKDVFPYLETLR